MRRVVEFRRQTDVAHHDISLLDADPRPAKCKPARQFRAAMDLGPVADRDGARDRLVRMVRQIERRVEDGMHCVPDEFVDHAAMIDDDPRYALEISIEQADKLFGTRARRQSRKALDIREQAVTRRRSPPSFKLSGAAAIRATMPGARCCSNRRLSAASRRRVSE